MLARELRFEFLLDLAALQTELLLERLLELDFLELEGLDEVFLCASFLLGMDEFLFETADAVLELVDARHSGLLGLGLLAVGFGLNADGFGELFLERDGFVAAGAKAAVGELLGGEALPFGDVGEPDLLLLWDVREVVGEVPLDHAELAAELFERSDFARVDRGLDLLHNLAHDFVTALAEGSEVAVFEFDANAAALVEHAAHLAIEVGPEGLFLEELDCLVLVVAVQVLDEDEIAGHLVGECFGDGLVVEVSGLFDEAFVLEARDLLEGVLEVGDDAGINGLGPGGEELAESGAADGAAVDGLDLEVCEDVAPEGEDLLVEVLAQVAQGKLVEPLELALVSERLDEGLAEAFLEVAADQRADGVLLRGLLGVALGVAQCVFEIVLSRDRLARLVLEAKREVAQDPVKGREIALDELLVVDVAVLELDVLGEVENEVEVFDGGLVDGPGGVVDEAAGEEQGE